MKSIINITCRNRHGCAYMRPDVEADRHEAVILVHGLIRSSFSMMSPAVFLRKKGFSVFIYDYYSTRHPIGRHADDFSRLLGKILEEDYRKVHFVTHSLGGIIARIALAKLADPKLGRLVMIAPPNQGSAKASSISRIWFAKQLLKPLDELRNDSDSFIRKVPVPKIEFGIIAGSMDAKVSVEESHLKNEMDHLVVNSFHTFIMNRKAVKEALLNFITEGKFGHTTQ
ncbi:MAG TPA: lipase [Lentisphaeria bacterium]|nr:MAG: hypothetical protein A2X45_25855 [Lentisphaerae bacterium GWF2_50_93]HCE43542.1 lipase [Lentisphaeria bacterium]